MPVSCKRVWKEEGRPNGSPICTMKQRILVFATLLVLLAAVFCGVATAAEDPIVVRMDLSSNRFSGPGEVTVTIQVTNTGDTDMTRPLALYDPNGNIIEDFGTPTLSAGASKTWTGTWMVTKEQLAQGRLTFAVCYSIQMEDGMTVEKQKNFYSTIVDAGAVAQVEVTRRITPTMAKKGQEVSVIYEIANVGTIDITNVTIQESTAVSKEQGQIVSVRAGEKATYVFTFKMGTKNVTSNATITYTANGKSYTDKVENATIKYGNVKLDATLAADKRGGDPGDTVKLTLTIKNTGKSDYQNVTVTDAALGTVFSGLTVKAGETVTEVKEITIATSAEYQFTVSGTDASGATVETATGRVPVTAVDATKAVSLEVKATADKETIYMLPGIVRFTVQVSNLSAVEAKNVTVSATGVTLYEFESIQPGETRTFVRDVRVETPGKFRFDAHVKDQLEQTATFEGNIVQIIHAAPTATPSQVPLATPARPQLQELPTDDGLPPYVGSVQSILSIATWVFVALGALCLGLTVVGAVSRIAGANRSRNAPDHLERDGYRDYTQAVPAKHRRMMPSEEAVAAPPPSHRDEERAAQEQAAEEAAAEQDGALLEEALSDLYPDAAAQEMPAEEAPAETAAAAEAPAVAETSTYRRRRRNDDA